MISILIPVFNTDVTALVSTLSRQLAALDGGGEILVMDDGSEAAFKATNQQVQTFSNTHYIELPQNVGRVQVRRRLAAKATNAWLLFIDGDSKILHPDFLANYIPVLSCGYDVVVGGRTYQKEKPQACSLRLHWRYGTVREDGANRKTGFMTNNFCIRSELFQKLIFDPPLKGYGHEDTWIGMQLEARGAAVGYIENRVLHHGLEPADVFLKKTGEALANLLALARVYDAATLRRHVRLYHYYCLQKKWHLRRPLLLLFQLFQNPILKNLSSCHPSLPLFDFYRLCTFIQLARSAKATVDAKQVVLS